MLQFVLAGLVLGGLYALAATGIVITYRATGIINFGFGALAYFIGRFYYFLNTQHHWGILPAGLVTILVLGPTAGVVLYYALFRMLRVASALVKVVVTLGVSVCLPPLAVLLFGNVNILGAPGLAPEPVRVFHLDGVPVTMDQLIVYIAVVVVVLAGALVLRFTDIGLRVRAMVDSPAMTSVSGSSPNAVSVGVWAVSSTLAGLAGVLAGPIIGLDSTDYTLLMASAFAAVIAAKLRNLPVAVLAALIMGVLGSLLERYLPTTGELANAIIPSVPFAVAAVVLVYNMIRSGRVNESDGVGGALDLAIRPQAGTALPESPAATALLGKITGTAGWRPSVVVIAIVAVCSFILPGYWAALVGLGIAYGIVFLSFTLVTGEGGMIWLCQVTFAGVGAITAAELATNHGWPVTVAVLMGGVVAMVLGLLIGLLTIRLGDLYVALVTLTFGLLMDNLVFSLNVFVQNGVGIGLNPPAYAQSATGLALVSLALFCIIGLVIVNLRRSTTGLALNAVRWSEPGAKTIGISVVQMKVIVSGLAAAVAGIGGGLLAIQGNAAIPGNFATVTGVTWLAVLVTAGIRSNIAALIAGLLFSIIPGAVVLYLTGNWGEVPPILFGAGAIGLAMNPEGFVMQNAKLALRFAARAIVPGGEGAL